MNPRHPVYIVSKGRWRREARLTSRYLHDMGVPHYIVVEASELEAYAAEVDSSATLLVLDPRYQAEYETCDELGDSKSRGPGPARNYAWEHSISIGATWHWVMDDNLRGFYRLNRNFKVPVTDGTILAAMEDFAERYSNVLMAGPNYFAFIARKSVMPPFVPNTRIYSCNLIRNDAPYRWRGRYNEDTDLSLRMLKDGYCTILFNAFLAFKVPTQSIRGGNTDAFYRDEGTLPKSRMLVELHPDVTKLVWRFGRPHHLVDYRPFRRNRLRRRPDLEISEGPNEYGMRFEERVGDEWTAT